MIQLQKFFLTGVLICLASLYLTFMIDVYTLVSTAQRIFVFCYFCIMSCLALFLKKKFMPTGDKKTLWIASLASVLLLTAYQNTFLPLQQDITISLSASGQNDLSTGGEVWLTAVTVDGEELALSQLEITENSSWIYNSEYDDYVYYPSEEAQENQLTFDLSCKTADLTFAANTWSGNVCVSSFSGNDQLLDLYSTDTERGGLTHSIYASTEYSLWQRCIYNCGLFCALTFLCSVLLQFMKKTGAVRTQNETSEERSHNKAVKISKLLVLLFMLAACILLAIAGLKGTPYYRADAKTLPSFLVESNRNRFVQDGDPGHLTFGPYLSLPKGEYTIIINYTCTEAGNYADICSEMGSTVHDEKPLVPGATECKFEVSFEQDIENLEVRTYYGGNGELYIKDLQINEPANYSWILLLVLLIVGLVNELCLIIFGKGANWTKAVDHRITFTGYGLLIYFLLFTSSPLITPVWSTKYILCVLTVVCVLLSEIGYRSKKMEKYLTVPTVISLMCVSVYASLASFAYRFFLAEDRITFSIQGVAYVLLGILWWLPIVFSVLYVMELISERLTRSSTKKNRKKAFISLFLVLCACQSVGILAFWPGGFPTDAMDQLGQAVGVLPLEDWHPILLTLLFRAIYCITSEPIAILVVQTLLFILLCTTVLMIGYDYGISLKWLAFIGGLFLLFPNQVFSSTNVMKDFPYMLSLLWGTWLLFRLAQNTRLCKTPWFCFSLIICLFLITGLRHNGILPFLLISMLCAGITAFNFREIKLRLMVSVLVASIGILIFKGPIFTRLNVIPNEVSTYTTMMTAAGSCINKELPLSEDAIEILESITTLDIWHDYYNQFAGHDDYRWKRPENTPFDMKHITAREAFKVYFEVLAKYPDVAIKDRLDGANIMWDISQPPNSFNIRSHDGLANYEYTTDYFDVDNLIQDEWGSYYNDSFLATVYRKLLNLSSHSFADIFLWRSGVYLVLLFVIFIFWWKNKMGRMFWAAIPMLGNIAGSLLVLYHQSFRYVHFIQVIVLTLLFLTLCTRNDYSEEPAFHQVQIPQIDNK